MKAHPSLLRILPAVLVLAAGCASGARPPAALPAPAPVAEGVGTVEPGDRILLKVWNEPAMSDTFPVTSAGTVILPKLGQVEVLGRAPRVLEDSLRQAYSAYLRNPSVGVQVLRRIGISGEVKSPGLYHVDLTMGLAEVINRAGGLTEAGNPNDVTLLRGSERTHFGQADRERLLVAQLRSGDQVIVGARSFVQRNPFVVVSTGMSLIGLVASIMVQLRK